MTTKLPDVKVSLPDGPAIYPCIAVCVRRIRKSGHASEIPGFIEDISRFTNYAEAVERIRHWVQVT
jgi:hypothetical protein